MPATIRCHVLEVPAQPHWAPRRERPRDLLPWADPYIAVLMDRLEERFSGEQQIDWSHESADEGPWSPPDDYDWQDDAFLPDRNEVVRPVWDPPVFGGWPLLDDLSVNNRLESFTEDNLDGRSL